LLGVAMSIEGLGLAIGTTVGGVLWDQFGPATPFHAAGVLVMIVAAGYVGVLRSLIAPIPHGPGPGSEAAHEAAKVDSP
jgi:predicted MFS family arabinose efflux permease